MKGIIIAGGLGTRLRPLTYHRPKPLVPVANRPFLEYQVSHLRQYGITDIVFATNYMAEQIEAHFGNGSRFGVRMQYALEDQPLGTGGAIRNAAALVPDEPVIVFNGDILMDFDLGQILQYHKEKQALATITLKAVPRPNPFGVLLLNSDGRVREWCEPSEATKKMLANQPQGSEMGSDLINAGCYILEPEFIKRIPFGKYTSIERETYPQLLEEGAPIFGFTPEGYWLDMGRPEQFFSATQDILRGAVRTAIEGMPVGRNVQIHETVQQDKQSVVGSFCCLESDVQLENTILMDHVTVGKGSHLSGIIVDTGTKIGSDVTIIGSPSHAVPLLSAGSFIPSGSRLIFSAS